VKQVLLPFHFLLAVSCAAQVEFSRSVISPFAMNAAAGGIEIYSTAGQPEFETFAQPPFFLTQGFEQPLFSVPVTFQLFTLFNLCTGQYEVSISGIGGCTSQDDAVITWNGEPGDSLFFTPDSLVDLTISGVTGCFYHTTLNLSDAPASGAGCGGLVFYSYFSPNGDGFNDVWVIESIASPRYGDNEVSILNRWGQEVWKESRYDNDSVVFAGRTSGGMELPDGTYYYVVRIGQDVYKGYIELQR
jgi:gliding motility-associated-like protein